METITDRDQLTECLRAGRTREAARIAGRLARAGAWDAVVAATLEVHARPDAPEREQARAWLRVPLAARGVTRGGDARAALGRTFEALARAGRLTEALTGLRLATRAGMIDATEWLGVAFILCAGGHTDEAGAIVEDALRRAPPSASVWAVAAQLRLARGRIEEAAEAVVRAFGLNPDSPSPHLTAAVLSRRAGDDRAARAHLDAARRLGAPAEVVVRYAAGS